MISGLCWCVGGLLVTIISFAMAVGTPGGSHYIVATGAIFWGGFRFVKNFAKVANK